MNTSTVARPHPPGSPLSRTRQHSRGPYCLAVKVALTALRRPRATSVTRCRRCRAMCRHRATSREGLAHVHEACSSLAKVPDVREMRNRGWGKVTKLSRPFKLSLITNLYRHCCHSGDARAPVPNPQCASGTDSSLKCLPPPIVRRPFTNWSASVSDYPDLAASSEIHHPDLPLGSRADVAVWEPARRKSGDQGEPDHSVF